MIEDGEIINPSEGKKNTNLSGIEDIFSDTDKVESKSRITTNNIIVEGGFNIEKRIDKNKNKLFIILLIIAVLFIVVFLFIYFLVNSYIDNSYKLDLTKEDSVLVNNLSDSDKDGIKDIDESKYGTNINLMDTDNDGLSDFDEIYTYKTNPNNVDTDNDGFGDFDEIKSGYDPNS